MEITLYNCSAAPNKLDKTSYMSEIGVYHVLSPTSQVNQLSPVVIIDCSADLINANYAYIDTFHRYYFCETSIDTAQRLIISCKVDYLMSWKDSIELCPATIIRAEQSGVNYVVDNELPIDQNRIFLFGADLDGDPLKISNTYLYRYLLITNS